MFVRGSSLSLLEKVLPDTSYNVCELQDDEPWIRGSTPVCLVWCLVREPCERYFTREYETPLTGWY